MREAGAGAVSMITGSAPTVAMARMRARGFSAVRPHVRPPRRAARPRRRRRCRSSCRRCGRGGSPRPAGRAAGRSGRASRRRARRAWRPARRTTGASVASPSAVVSGRGCSSFSSEHRAGLGVLHREEAAAEAALALRRGRLALRRQREGVDAPRGRSPSSVAIRSALIPCGTWKCRAAQVQVVAVLARRRRRPWARATCSRRRRRPPAAGRRRRRPWPRS